MDYHSDQAIEILRRTPSTLKALLSGLPEVWTHSSTGSGTWSAFDVIGHLLHGEQTDWMPRVKIIIAHGQDQPFEPFNRTAMLELFHDDPLDRLLDAFAEVRKENLEELRRLNITPDMLDFKGIHPSLGTVTLRQLLSTWVVHDLNHVGQIVEVMSRQYAEAVGPWKAYLAILTRPVLTE